jgi:hypothetical protein
MTLAKISNSLAPNELRVDWPWIKEEVSRKIFYDFPDRWWVPFRCPKVGVRLLSKPDELRIRAYFAAAFLAEYVDFSPDPEAHQMLIEVLHRYLVKNFSILTGEMLRAEMRRPRGEMDPALFDIATGLRGIADRVMDRMKQGLEAQGIQVVD